MSKRTPTLLRWIEAHEAQLASEQAVLARREDEWEALARHARRPEAPAPGLMAPIRGVRIRLALAYDALLGRGGRSAGTAAVSKPATKAAILFLGFLPGIGAVGLSPPPGEAKSAPPEAAPVVSSGAEAR